MGRCAPGQAPLSLSGPAVPSRLAQGASIIHDDPGSAPSEERARTLTGRPRVKPRAEFSMKDDRVIPSTYPGGCHLRAPARPPAKVRGEPSSAVSVNKKAHTSTPPLGSVCVFFSYTWKGHLYCCTEGVSTSNHPPPHPPSLSDYNSAANQATF